MRRVIIEIIVEPLCLGLHSINESNPSYQLHTHAVQQSSLPLWQFPDTVGRNCPQEGEHDEIVEHLESEIEYEVLQLNSSLLICFRF